MSSIRFVYVVVVVTAAFASSPLVTNAFSATTPRSHHRTTTTTTSLWATPATTSPAAATDDDDDATPPLGKPGTAEMGMPWEDLGFQFRDVKSHLKLLCKDGVWGEPELVEGNHIQMHIGATALHYGQSCFEGLKAFAHKDDSVHIFRPDENAKRLRTSCERLMMPPVPPEKFLAAVNTVVRDNVVYVPPYGSNGALYLRPLLFGSGPRIGLQPADEYTLLIMVMPVADYYKGGLSSLVDALVIEDFDRAAPRGVGAVKVAGNYAADLLPNMLGKKKGYPIGLYLDAATRSTVEEFSTSNFVGVNNDAKTYVTPYSPASVLPSITNKSLMTIARDEGLTVEEREIRVDELDDFDEVFACGTAVVLTPVGSVTREKNGEVEKVHRYNEDGKIGDTTMRLYDRVRAIQNGEEEDKYGWNFRVY